MSKVDRFRSSFLADREDRARAYTEYVHSVIDNPYFVGCHFFQTMDSPLTGRAHDGENYNIGFVRVTDVPYQPMVDAAKKIHANLYQRRFGASSLQGSH